MSKDFSFATFTKPEFLLAVETLYNASKSHGQTEDDQMHWFIAELSELCYDQGIIMAKAEHSNTPYVDLTDCLYHAIKFGQARWEIATSYLKDTLDVRLYPLGLLVVLSKICKSGEYPELKEASHRFLKDWIQEASEECKPVEVVSVPDIENFSGDPKELISAYFDMANQLGTFYGDRSKYENDDQRKLHDKMVAIFNKLGQSIFRDYNPGM